MKSNQSVNSFNKEFDICRWRGGIKLMRPNQQKHNAPIHYIYAKYNLGDLFNMPFNVYFVDKNSVIQYINDSTINDCGFYTLKDALGKTVEIAAKKETALKEYAHDRKVIQEEKLVIMQEHYQRLDHVDLSYISLKFPWYNEENTIIGVFGCSLQLYRADLQAFPDHLSLLVNTGLLSVTQIDKANQNNSLLTIDGITLTQRESECVRLVCKGFSAKQIGNLLHISHRTAENYLASVKNKLNITTRSALIEKIRFIYPYL